MFQCTRSSKGYRLQPVVNVIGASVGRFCVSHKQDGMIDVRSRAVSRSEHKCFLQQISKCEGLLA